MPVLVHNYPSKPGDADYTGKLNGNSWKLVSTGDGAHLIERANIKGRIGLQKYNQSNTPRYYPYGGPENAGQAHIRLHRATKKAGIRLRNGNPNMSDAELLDKYTKAYSSSELVGIKGDLRTPDSSEIVLTNATPLEAFKALLKWGNTH